MLNYCQLIKKYRYKVIVSASSMVSKVHIYTLSVILTRCLYALATIWSVTLYLKTANIMRFLCCLYANIFAASPLSLYPTPVAHINNGNQTPEA